MDALSLFSLSDNLKGSFPASALFQSDVNLQMTKAMAIVSIVLPWTLINDLGKKNLKIARVLHQ